MDDTKYKIYYRVAKGNQQGLVPRTWVKLLAGARRPGSIRRQKSREDVSRRPVIHGRAQGRGTRPPTSLPNGLSISAGLSDVVEVDDEGGTPRADNRAFYDQHASTDMMTRVDENASSSTSMPVSAANMMIPPPTVGMARYSSMEAQTGSPPGSPPTRPAPAESPVPSSQSLIASELASEFTGRRVDPRAMPPASGGNIMYTEANLVNISPTQVTLLQKRTMVYPAATARAGSSAGSSDSFGSDVARGLGMLEHGADITSMAMSAGSSDAARPIAQERRRAAHSSRSAALDMLMPTGAGPVFKRGESRDTTLSPDAVPNMMLFKLKELHASVSSTSSYRDASKLVAEASRFNDRLHTAGYACTSKDQAQVLSLNVKLNAIKKQITTLQAQIEETERDMQEGDNWVDDMNQSLRSLEQQTGWRGWSVAQVGAWLRETAWSEATGSLKHYATKFSQNKVDGRVLATLSKSDLQDIGVQVLAERIAIFQVVEKLRKVGR